MGGPGPVGRSAPSLPPRAPRADATPAPAPAPTPATPRPAVGDSFDTGTVRLASTADARRAACDDFLRGVSPPPSDATRARMERSLESFSDDQLRRMRDAGVRFWPQEQGLPPDVLAAGAAGPGVDSPAGYIAGARTLRYGPGTTVAEFRHELGHAWDDVGTETRSMRLDEMSTRDRSRAIRTLHREVERGTAFGSTRDSVLRDAFEDYRGRVDRADGSADGRFTTDARERAAFDLGAREGYSLSSVEEFYAEGRSAFHGSAERAARMERNAPGLYRRLAEEARDAGTLPAWVDPATLATRPIE